MWSPFKVYRDLAAAQGKVEFYADAVKELRERIDELEEERKKLIDWLLSINGAPSSLYGESEKEKVLAKPQNPFVGTTKATDFKRIAEELEAEGMR